MILLFLVDVSLPAPRRAKMVMHLHHSGPDPVLKVPGWRDEVKKEAASTTLPQVSNAWSLPAACQAVSLTSLLSLQLVASWEAAKTGGGKSKFRGVCYFKVNQHGYCFEIVPTVNGKRQQAFRGPVHKVTSTLSDSDAELAASFDHDKMKLLLFGRCAPALPPPPPVAAYGARHILNSSNLAHCWIAARRPRRSCITTWRDTSPTPRRR